MPYEAENVEPRKPVTQRSIRTVDEVLNQFFEHRIGRNKLYQMVREQKIPFMRVDRKILFCLEDLEEWWDAQTSKVKQQDSAGDKIRKLF